MNKKEAYRQAQEALSFLKEKMGEEAPQTVVVLGSGLGAVADSVENATILATKEIPHWPVSTAPGHAGRLVTGVLEGRKVAVLQGRVHYYEGYSMADITFPVRVLGMWGATEYLATNASGGIHFDFHAGDIVAVLDHINLMGANPLRGPSEPRWNVRFPDMSQTYSSRLLSVMDRAAHNVGQTLKRGVYAAFSGPSYETPAEIRMARILGADLVGMSTVPEVIVASAMGMEVGVFSCVANKAAGLGLEKLTEEDVLHVMEETADKLTTLVRETLGLLSRNDGAH